MIGQAANRTMALAGPLIGIMLLFGVIAAIHNLTRGTDRTAGGDWVRSFQLEPFLVGQIGKHKVRFDLDTNTLHLTYSSDYTTAEAYFAAVRDHLPAGVWILTDSAPLTRTYRRGCRPPAGVVAIERVALRYHPAAFEVSVVAQRVNDGQYYVGVPACRE